MSVVVVIEALWYVCMCYSVYVYVHVCMCVCVVCVCVCVCSLVFVILEGLLEGVGFSGVGLMYTCAHQSENWLLMLIGRTAAPCIWP